MIRKIVLSLLSVLMGAVFIFSGYTKLYPIEPFELTFVDLGVASWRVAPFIARLFISLEFFIGILFIFNIKIKAVCKLSFVTLIVFSLYLLGLMFIAGNKGNCGCFGNYLAMTPLQALIKNIIMLAIVVLIYKWHTGLSFKGDTVLYYLFMTTSLGIPHVLNYVDLDYSQAYLTKREDFYKIELDTLYKHAEINTPPKALSVGKHVIAFVSATCPHCRIAAKKIKIMMEKNPSLPIYFVINGDEKGFKAFFEDTKATNVPYCKLNGKGFVFLAGTSMPYIALVNNSMVETSVDYMHLDQEQIENWLAKK